MINFLKQRGLTIKNTLVLQGKPFRPGSSLRYLSFKLIYSNLNKFNFSKDEPTRSDRTPAGIGVKVVSSGYLRRSFYVLIQNRGIRNLRDKLKARLSKKNSGLAVNQMISDLNTILVNSFKYYNMGITVKRQLFSLNDLLHKLFYKYLLRKYSSLPKIYSCIDAQLRYQGKFTAKNKFLLRITGIDSLTSVNPCSIQSRVDKK